MGFDLISRLLFPTPPPSYNVDSFPEELIWVPKSLDPENTCPEECVPCLLLPYSSARFLVFYLHSNAEDIGRCHTFCRSLRAQFQVHVLAVEYPGYGICPGGPCDEHRATSNAFTAFRFVHEVLEWPLDSIIILGRSIGCGPAISLAVHYEVSGVIVVSPMLSVKEICWDILGPLSYAVHERFPNKDRVPLMGSPFLVVHGQKDSIIPCRHGVDLYKACKSRKLLVCPQDMEHNTNLLADISYLVLPMLQFFSLPDYCFEEMRVPTWVYNKRLSPYYCEPPPLPWTSSNDDMVPMTVPSREPSDCWAASTCAPMSFNSDDSKQVSAWDPHDNGQKGCDGCVFQVSGHGLIASLMSPLLGTRDIDKSHKASQVVPARSGPSVVLPLPSPPACDAPGSANVPTLAQEDLLVLRRVGERTLETVEIVQVEQAKPTSVGDCTASETCSAGVTREFPKAMSLAMSPRETVHDNDQAVNKVPTLPERERKASVLPPPRTIPVDATGYPKPLTMHPPSTAPYLQGDESLLQRCRGAVPSTEARTASQNRFTRSAQNVHESPSEDSRFIQGSVTQRDTKPRYVGKPQRPFYNPSASMFGPMLGQSVTSMPRLSPWAADGTSVAGPHARAEQSRQPNVTFGSARPPPPRIPGGVPLLANGNSSLSARTESRPHWSPGLSLSARTGQSSPRPGSAGGEAGFSHVDFQNIVEGLDRKFLAEMPRLEPVLAASLGSLGTNFGDGPSLTAHGSSGGCFSGACGHDGRGRFDGPTSCPATSGRPTRRDQDDDGGGATAAAIARAMNAVNEGSRVEDNEHSTFFFDFGKCDRADGRLAI
eukprot:TRINITY_DN18791_c0_g1_i1.p1 TRINITY_DN18791_c0_g1~~TRINITY_DN18791_c0_g1_i1.p1  ORF type:complete len:824 (+),score=121.45 TRINITY_DN18791_c0_g1_i1:178-2649(+)